MQKKMTTYDLGQWDYTNDNVRSHDAKPKHWSQQYWSDYWEGVNDAARETMPDIASLMMMGNLDS
jgi:hypothetical protein